MQTLKQVLEPFLIQPDDNLITILKKATTFSNILKANDGKDKILTTILDVCELIGNRYPSANLLLDMLNQVGIDENIELNKLINFFKYASEIHFNFKNLCQHLPDDFYELFKDDLEEVDHKVILNFVKELPFVDQHTDIKYADSKYYVPKDFSIIKKIISMFHTEKHKYIPERTDCDDYALMFKSFLSEHKLGNLGCGILWGIFIDEDKNKVVYHAINLIIYKDGNELKYRLYEPQLTMKFYNIGNPKEVWDKLTATFILF